MPTILREGTRAAIVAAIEMNEAAYWLYRAARASWDVAEEPDVTLYRSGEANVERNGVLLPRLTEATAEARIAAICEHFMSRSLPFLWWEAPPALEPLLAAQGLVLGSRDAGMAAERSRVPEAVPLPAGISVERVRDDAGACEWRAALYAGHGEPPPSPAPLETFAPASYGEDEPLRCYLARREDGTPVATAQLLLAAGVAGIYCITTVPQERGRGIGTAVTHAALREAHALGYAIGVLGATALGEGVYRRLGFKQYMEMTAYEWYPPPAGGK
jgi:GNAT superfamily N-acetyltransferase